MPISGIWRRLFIGSRMNEYDYHVGALFQSVCPSIVEDLTSDDVRLLIETEDEWDRRGRFTRIFPSPGTNRYLKYFDVPKYPNLLLDEWTSQYFYMRERGIRLALEIDSGGKI